MANDGLFKREKSSTFIEVLNHTDIKRCILMQSILQYINYLSRFRIGVCTADQLRSSTIQCNVGLHSLYVEHEEDEIHIFLQCPVYHDVRTRYLHPFTDPPNNQ